MQVYSHGGDVMRFAGDSVICAFLPTADEVESGDRGLAAATQRAVRCAAVLANDLGKRRAHICQLGIMAMASGVLRSASGQAARGQHGRVVSGLHVVYYMQDGLLQSIAEGKVHQIRPTSFVSMVVVHW